MRKRIISAILPLGMVMVPALAQVELSTADLLRIGALNPEAQLPGGLRRVAAENGQQLELIIRYDSPDALEAIRQAGGEIVSLVGTRTAIVAVKAQDATRVAGSLGVTGASLSKKLAHANDEACMASDVPQAREYPGMPDGCDGRGVVVGLFDTGIDPNHINFQNADGSTRLSSFWNYPGTSARPEEYATPSQIKSFTSDTSSESHGTHVLGIMAGSFRDLSSPSAPDYRGVAPGAEIVAAAGAGYDAQILDGIERMASYAAAQGKPCVLNLSFGDNIGPHDGTDEFTEAINDIAAKYDAVICVAAGNERDSDIALVRTFSVENTEYRTLLCKGPEEVGGNFQVYGPIEIWSEDDTPFEVSLDIIARSNPDNPSYSLEIPEKKETYVVQGDNIKNYLSNTAKMDLISSGTEFQSLYTNSFMGGVRGIDAYNGRYNAKLNVYIEGRTASAVNRNSIRLSVKGEPGKKVYIYTAGNYMVFGNRNIPGLEVPDGYGTNSNMASGDETFTVGSYVSANRPESPYEAATVGDISYFSSYGETGTGRVMPDLCAPGQVLISSRNSYLSSGSTYEYYYPSVYTYTDSKSRKSYRWTTCAGTSQATPHMAGIFALWRQANPLMTRSELYNVARESASPTGFDSPGWGAGKANALEGLKTILNPLGVENFKAGSPDTFLINRNGSEIKAEGADELITLTLFDIGGNCVASASAVKSLSLPTNGLSKGLYFLKVSSPSSSFSCKIII